MSGGTKAQNDEWLTDAEPAQYPTAYVVVPAPGSYGDRTRVMSSHRTAAAAVKAARRASSDMFRAVARESYRRRGDEWLRKYDEVSPIVGGEVVS